MSLEAPSGAKWEVVCKMPVGILDCEATRRAMASRPESTQQS